MNNEDRFLRCNMLKRPMIRFVIGIGIILIIGVADSVTKIFSGGLLSILLLSIICTAGIGLIFLIPIALLMGTMVSLLINFLFFRSNKSDLIESDKALQKYILDAKNYGKSREETNKLLTNAGWKETEINPKLQDIYS